MRAVISRNQALVVEAIAEPIPAAGQVLVKSLACGICGSDLHSLDYMHDVVEATGRAGMGEWIDADRDIVFGHEFCAEILEHGPGSPKTLKAGTRVVSMPFIVIDGKLEWIGISNTAIGGFAERMLLTEALLLPVPNGLDDRHAAMVEPMAVGVHAVAEARLSPGTPAVVIGCGPVGLAVIAALVLAGHGPIVAADFSPERRRVAEAMGAHVVIDPAIESPHANWEAFGVAPTVSHQAQWSLIGRTSRPSVAFECVGAPGLIQSLINDVPPGTQIVVVGVCMKPDKFEPFLGVNKQLIIRFVQAYTADEFTATLHKIAEGSLDVAAVVSSEVGLDEVGDAFERLRSPGRDVKIIVRPD